MSNLHNDIMNLQTGKDMPEELPARLLYKQGHRDARHAAAELAIKHDAERAKLVEALQKSQALLKSRQKRGCDCGLGYECSLCSVVDQNATLLAQLDGELG